MSQELNMNEKPKLERKKTPLRQLNADKTTIPRDDQLDGQSYGQESIAQEKWKEPTAFDSSKPITDKPADKGRAIEVTKVECAFPEAGKEKYGEGMPKGDFSDKPVTKDDEWTKDQQSKPAEWSEGQQKPGVFQEAKHKLHQGVEKTKEAFTSDKPTTTTTTTTPDSELENKPGVIERVKGVFTGPTTKDSGYTDDKPGVIQEAKNMVWQGVEKAKGVFSSAPKWTEPTELHPGNGYDWKRVVGDQGQVRWMATNDWSGDSANRGGILEGAKGMVRSGVEKAKGVFSSKDAKESEYTGYDQPLTQDQSKPGVLQGAKDKVWQGVEKAKSVFSSSSAPTEEHPHPGKSYSWHKTTGDQGQPHWVARDDWSADSAAQQPRPGVLQGAKEKVMQGVEKAKGVFSNKPTDAATTTPPAVPTVEEPQPVQGLGYKKIEIEKEHAPSGYGREKMTVEKSADPQFKKQTGFKEQTGTYSS